MEGNVDVVKYLLLHGASHNAKDRLGRYPLDDAVLFRHKEVVKLLHDAGAHLGKNSTEIAAELCRFAAKNRVDDLYVWQLAGANLNSFDYDKRTPLHVVSVHIHYHTQTHVKYMTNTQTLDMSI